MKASKRGNRNIGVLTGACLAGGFALAFPQASHASVVFQDTFGSGSTLNGSGPVTSSQTNYTTASNKKFNTSPADSIGPNALFLSQAASTGAATELQALFTSTPVVLTNVGDSISMTVVFEDNQDLNTQNGTSTSGVYFGLYNSGGVAPFTNLQSASVGGLTSTSANDATGGTEDWAGYYSRISTLTASNSSAIVTRPSQAGGTTNTDQDLLFGTISNGFGYSTTPGSSLASGNSTDGAEANLTSTDTYTEVFAITLSAPGTYTISSTLTNDTTSSLAASLTGTDPAQLFNGFSGLGIGWSDKSNSGTTEITLNSITIDGPNVPEPASLGLIGLTGLGLLRRRRSRS